MPLNFQKARDWLSQFDFHNLFIQELGWNQPASQTIEFLKVEHTCYAQKRLAEMAGVPVFEITTANGEVPQAADRAKIHQVISATVARENLLIFVTGDRTRSLWYWAKWEGSKAHPRTTTYIRYQPVDLFLSQISRLKFDLVELAAAGEVAKFEVADRLQKRPNVEQVTKRFYQDFKLEYQQLLSDVQGIDQESDRRWYVSLILNRLMVIYFLQKRGFLGGGDIQYLSKQLKASQQRGTDRFLSEFLKPLFFEGFAKPDHDRTPEVKALIGQVCYLNAGLFLKHPTEQAQPQITIPDSSFQRVLALFEQYSWNLDDRPTDHPQEINPDVLGYIFEKSLNQKAFGAYYTGAEMTEYLCDRTINKLILKQVRAALLQQQIPHKIQSFANIDDLVMHLEIDACRHLIYGENSILQNLSLLDPACGSGAFLLAALKTLTYIYERVIGVIQLSTDRPLRDWLQAVLKTQPSWLCLIKKRIITDNLYGVDIMAEAVEMTKLRLFLALASTVQQVNELEPLLTIDFNIMTGNSLIGFIRVDEAKFNAIAPADAYPMSLSQSATANRYREILAEKNSNTERLKNAAFGRSQLSKTEQKEPLQRLRAFVDKLDRASEAKLNQLLLHEFSHRLGIQYELAELTGKPKKRNLTIQDIAALKPFHWGYHCDRVIQRGGFDAIITNPPWEIFKPNAREFFSQHNELVSKRKMDVRQFEKAQTKLLQDPEIALAWVAYQSQYPHVSAYYRSTEQYKNQSAIVNGKKAGTDVNLYKLFLEQCFNLLQSGGECGILLPAGIYTDLGAKQLREMLFSQCQIDALYGISNERLIFEDVDHRCKFCLLTFSKGNQTDSFTAAFRIDPREAVSQARIGIFLDDAEAHLKISTSLIRKLSSESLSVMEFKHELEIQIAQKMSRFPRLGETIDHKWNLGLCNEFHMTHDSHLFQDNPKPGSLPLFEGRVIHQFTHQWRAPKYWIDESQARRHILKKAKDFGQILAYQKYRLAFREIARSSDTRSLIATVLPKAVFANHKLMLSNLNRSRLTQPELLYTCGLLNSLVVDFLIRQRLTTSISMFLCYQLPVPRLVEGDLYFNEIVERAAKLICVTPEFDDLAAEVGLGCHTNGVTDQAGRAQLRAELDGIIAHLYGLTEAEFIHILGTFPIVPATTKEAALAEYRQRLPTAAIAHQLL